VLIVLARLQKPERYKRKFQLSDSKQAARRSVLRDIIMRKWRRVAWLYRRPKHGHFWLVPGQRRFSRGDISVSPVTEQRRSLLDLLQA
jgi:hypothetical protein